MQQSVWNVLIIIKKELPNFNISDRKCVSKQEAHRPKNWSGTIIKFILIHIFFYIFFKKNSKLVREMWIRYIIRLELQKPKSAAWEKYIINLGNKLLGLIIQTKINVVQDFPSIFILDSIQFQIYFMSIQIYFCTSNHTILHKGSNFHSTCITNRLNPSVFGGAISSGPLNYKHQTLVIVGEPWSFFACHSNTHSIIKSPSFLWFKVFNNYTKYRKVTG